MSNEHKIYLDYNATTPARPEVVEAVCECLQGPHNASSVHSFGRAGRKMVERAREQVAALIGAPTNQVIFNAGATEGNNTVLRHFAGQRILASAIEHPSVLKAVEGIETVPVTSNGLLNLDALETALKDKPAALVSLMMVNNETGVIQPVAEAGALAHKYGALFHCDAVQATGRIPVNIAERGIDFLTLSAHKLGGPQGVGALALGLCGITPTLLSGGGQEKQARAGTENVAGIAGFGIAAELAAGEIETYEQKTAALQTKLENALQDVLIHGQNAPRVTNTTLFSLPGASSETLLMALDLDGIAVSNGSACSSGRITPSHVLKAMTASDAEAASAIRISTGWNTTEKDIDRFIEVWQNIANRIQKRA
ncbi:MAG: cysteine desulfurase [Rhodospirillales bacterium]|nr:cysteine desulfurase [Rhodospirillales bacterium]